MRPSDTPRQILTGIVIGLACGALYALRIAGGF